jgi:SPP1 gp7 family putative phage head morphogenesis protein
VANQRPLPKPLTANEIIYDRSVRHALAIERFKNGEARRVHNFLTKELIPDLRKEIKRLEKVAARGQSINPARMERLQRILRGADEVVRTKLSELFRRSKKSLTALARSEAEWQVGVFRQAIPSGLALEFTTPAPALLNSIVTARPFEGRLLRKWYGDLTRSTQAQVRSAVNIGLAQGESVPTITRRVVAAAQTTRRHATVITRTAIKHVSAHAAESTYKQNSDVIKAVQFVATLDDRTTEICMVNDGKIFPIDSGPRPPLHHQCRSHTAPVMKSWRELGINLKEAPPGTRASMNGQVPASLTYPQWLRRQPVEVQNRALGVGRARLFRGNRVKIDKFVNEQGRTLSLAELRAQEGL